MHIQHHGGRLIRLLDTQRLHRQRKGRRKTVTVMDHEELAAHFSVAPHQPQELKGALIAAGWHFHEDAHGRLWAVPPPGSPTTG